MTLLGRSLGFTITQDVTISSNLRISVWGWTTFLRSIWHRREFNFDRKKIIQSTGVNLVFCAVCLTFVIAVFMAEFT